MKIEQSGYVKLIEGKVLRDIGRASDMAWLSIGNTIKVRNLKGKEVLKGTFAIHIQCPWRMIDNEKSCILFSSYDMYMPNKVFSQKKDFDWDIQGANLYDEKVIEWKNRYGDVLIESVYISSLGDLKMKLSNGHSIEIFINTSSSEECWRFFECNTKKKHLVYQGTGSVLQ